MQRWTIELGYDARLNRDEDALRMELLEESLREVDGTVGTFATDEDENGYLGVDVTVEAETALDAIKKANEKVSEKAQIWLEKPVELQLVTLFRENDLALYKESHGRNSD